jgi:hypothetical protein
MPFGELEPVWRLPGKDVDISRNWSVITPFSRIKNIIWKCQFWNYFTGLSFDVCHWKCTNIFNIATHSKILETKESQPQLLKAEATMQSMVLYSIMPCIMYMYGDGKYTMWLSFFCFCFCFFLCEHARLQQGIDH